jgi:hypothetical protein
MIAPPADPYAAFEIANTLALAGWATLCLSPLLPRRAVALVAGTVLPVLLSLAYCALVLAFWSGAPGGFGSLQEVMALFTVPEIALAGWLHYLAFDMLVGVAIVRAARDEDIAFAAVLPCLGLAFMFGPAGFLAFAALRWTRAAARAAAIRETRP